MTTGNPTIEVKFNDFEQIMQARGYVFVEDKQFGGQTIQVYEKPTNPKYLIERIAHPDGLEDAVADLAQELNKNRIFKDGFDSHDKRREWINSLSPTDAKNYKALVDGKNKLRLNRVNNIATMLHVIKNNVKDPVLQSSIDKYSQDLLSMNRSDNYDDFSLSDKVLYMEEVDKIVMKVLDLVIPLLKVEEFVAS